MDSGTTPQLIGPATISTEYRQTRRALARRIAAHGLKKLLGQNASRKARRYGARAYANAAWRRRRGIPGFAANRHNDVILNRAVLIWTMNEAGL